MALSAGILAAPGCKAVRKFFSPADQVELGSADPVSTMNQATLSDPQSRRGLEVRMLVVDDTNYDAPRLLRNFDSQTASGFDAQTRARWEDWGFRLVEVPMNQLEPMLSELTPVRPVSVQWLGEFGAWRALIRAGYSEQTRVRVGAASRIIEPGRPRLIARSWVEPMLTDSASISVIRLDLGMQIESNSRNSFALLPDQRTRTLDDDGLIIDELLSTITLRGDRAIVIIGEAPGTDWGKLPEPAAVEFAAGSGDDAVGPEAEKANEQKDEPDSDPKPSPRPFASSTAQPVGPQAPSLRSLGELMLVARGSRLTRANETRDIPRRVLIVLVPSVRGDFEILNIPSAGSGS